MGRTSYGFYKVRHFLQIYIGDFLGILFKTPNWGETSLWVENLGAQFMRALNALTLNSIYNLDIITYHTFIVIIL